jgi:naphthoate synthase
MSFPKADWQTAKEYQDITYKKSKGVARIAFNRPAVRNAFRPNTTKELYDAFHDANEDTSIGVVLLSAEGPSTKDGIWSFCSGGDQRARGQQGYLTVVMVQLI